jgi:hypothetical protein
MYFKKAGSMAQVIERFLTSARPQYQQEKMEGGNG